MPTSPSRRTFASSGEDGFARKAGGAAEFFFNAQQLVVFCDAVGARSRAGLDLTGARRNRQVRDKRIFGLARAVRNDGVVAGLARQFNGVNRLRDAADLIQLD